MYPVTYKLDLLFPLPQAHLSKERLQAKMLGSGLLGTGEIWRTFGTVS